jgi:hypothetical protein
MAVAAIALVIVIQNELVNAEARPRVAVVNNTTKGSIGMAFGPQSQQIEFGSHSLVIDSEDRKVRVFSDLAAPEYESSRDWREVSEKLHELGVRELSEVPSENSDSVLCAEGAY